MNLITFAALTLYLNSNGTQAIAVYIMIGLYFVQFLTLIAIQFYSVFLQLLKKESYKTSNGYENLDIQNSNGTQAIAVYIMIGLYFVQFLTLIAIQFYSVFLQLLKKESYKTSNGYENLDIQISEDDIRE